VQFEESQTCTHPPHLIVVVVHPLTTANQANIPFVRSFLRPLFQTRVVFALILIASHHLLLCATTLSSHAVRHRLFARASSSLGSSSLSFSTNNRTALSSHSSASGLSAFRIASFSDHSTMSTLSATPASGEHPSVQTSTDTLQLPALDTRHYRALTLTNQLRALLISDPECDKAAAAMDVRVGHLSDPDDIPGLAHFHEHMLFLGTEKYPEESNYTSFLQQHGGSSNAYTSTESTNFYFEVQHQHLEGALDRFAQFFISPLFTADATDREMQAVDSENGKNLQQDQWRMYQMIKMMAAPTHPFHKFGTGNLITLKTAPEEKGINVREALLKFHDDHVSANNLRLVVVGRHSIDELTDMVESMFAPVKNLDLPIPYPPPGLDVPPFGPEQLGFRYNMVPVGDNRGVKMIFPMPAYRQHYESKPGRYASNLIGHEGPGSIASFLKNEKHWINALVAGPSRSSADFELFQVSMDVTETGWDHLDEIIATVFQYIRLLQTTEVHEWLWKELAVVSELEFKYKDQDSPADAVSRLSAGMQLYRPEHFVSGPYLISKFEPDLIMDLIRRLTPDNMNLLVYSPTLEAEATEREKWYGTKYSKVKLVPEVLEHWRTATVTETLAMPNKNEFIPSNLHVKSRSHTESFAAEEAPASATLSEETKAPKVYPTKVFESALSTIWHKQDDLFHLPKGICSMLLVSKATPLSPRNYVLTHLLAVLCENDVMEYGYYAELAGLRYSLNHDQLGMVLTLRGFDEKLSLLGLKVLERLCSLKVKESSFLQWKDAILRNYKNFSRRQPYEHAQQQSNVCLLHPQWTQEEKMAALEPLSLQDLEAFIPEFLSQLKVEAIYHGNFEQEEVIHYVKDVESLLVSAAKAAPIPSELYPERRAVCLEPGKTYVRRIAAPHAENDNSAIYLYFQVGQADLQQEALMDMLCQMIREPAYDYLRTKKQLGYIVWSGVRSVFGVEGFRVIIQSTVEDPVGLRKHIEEFLLEFEKDLHNMSTEEFNKHISTVSARKLESDQKLSQETAKYWQEIYNGRYAFDQRERQVEVLKTLDKDQVSSFFSQYIAKASPTRTVFSTEVFGAKFPLPSEPLEDEILIEDVVQFRRKSLLFPSI